MEENTIAIDVDNLTVVYQGEPVLEQIHLKIPSGHLAAVVGPNGAGKTTLIKSILNLIDKKQGTVHFPQIGSETLKNKMAYVPQCNVIDWDFPATVFDVVMMGRYGHIGWFRRASKNDKNLVLEVLDKVEMLEYKDRQIGQLSGGQQQRVFLARALAQEGEIYLLDEPFKGVDVTTEEIIVNLLKELRDQGKTILVVHHDLDTVEAYFDWIVMLNKEIIANGTISSVFTQENICQTYCRKVPVLNTGS